MTEQFNIEKFHNNQKILNDTLDQIEKDFDFSGIPIQFKRHEKYSYQQIMAELCKTINELTVKNYESLLHLLYRIDINEDRVKKELNEQSNRNSEEIIAELILKRELQKVVLKEYYKNKGNEH